MKQHLSLRYWLTLLSALVITILLSASIGSVAISPVDIGKMLVEKLPGVELAHSWTRAHETILLRIRLPRILLAMGVGGGLSVAGVLFQGLLRNPLADPYIIGVSAGASLGAAVALLFIVPLGIAGIAILPPFAFVGALLAAVTVYRLGTVRGKIQPIQLLLAGVAVAAFLTAMVSFLIVLRIQNLQDVYLWLMGSLAGRNWGHVSLVAAYTFPGLVLSMWLARDLNVLLLGEETAHSLGVNVKLVQQLSLILGSFLAAAAVSVSGVIGFVGLMVPHGVRLVVGPNHRVLLPCAFFAGAIFLIIADTLARTLLSPVEIPVGVITAFLGGPFFLYLLTKHMRGDSVW